MTGQGQPRRILYKWIVKMVSQDESKADGKIVWRYPPLIWLSWGILLALLGFIYQDGLARMLTNWIDNEEYSHGWFIPLISGYLIWQKRDEISSLPVDKPWPGVVLTLFGLAIYFLGEMSAITVIVMYSMIIVLAGVAMSLVGWTIFKRIWIAFLFLVFMIPIPSVIYQQLSQSMQLISSELGVMIIRLLGISVYLEGNVIDLGTYKLQVVEACSGLRYLFPLMSLAFICAYFFRDAFWKRILVFFSSIPIAISLNSLRIGVIGILVEYFGSDMAEGFLHDFEGWIVFMICLALLLLEIWALSRIRGKRRPFPEVFGFDVPGTPSDGVMRYRTGMVAYGVSVLLVATTAVGATAIAERQEYQPHREILALFPATLGEWKGRRETMEPIYVDRLSFTDYYLGDYFNKDATPINLYIAYYQNQRRGESIHSPRACLPGSGWKIESLRQIVFDDIKFDGVPLEVNRVVIKKGEFAQLVYYWFKQRERHLTDEYEIKWWLLWDAVERNRTDGALIRMTTIVPQGQSFEAADRKLSGFLHLVVPRLNKFIPN